ncbi:TPA: S-methyl-5-thioribose-1-phosphate isomerase [archaeon]|jgi:ribose 1,5-bisphosphate isomerase|uniref:S-methyl-5-thioribose-1-phosphate isomerase n=1 Tax=Candidatus Undinarchaeum marinum TaxID=2756141 RepID=A0A832UTN2_9ARCH|nr:S-methyl-5-thioribose-1-phosphate isomerase [Candidatus Undinarchaeum marinum]
MSVESVARDIREMKIQGAVTIAMAAEEALEEFIKNCQAGSRDDFLSQLRAEGNKLAEARPSAIALPNAVDMFIEKVEAINLGMPDLKDAALLAGKELMEDTKDSFKELTEKGSEIVRDGQLILIHCHSSTVTGILKKAWDSGKRFNVICTETRPSKQGFISAKELAEHEIPTTIVIDSAVASVMAGVDIALVGADTILKNGDVVNKIGTLGVALAAKEFGVPMYVATQRLKFDTKGKGVGIESRPAEEILEGAELPGVEIENLVFDITKKSYFKGIITEGGIRLKW